MCGITGFVGPWDRACLEQMTELIRHRGPDDAGYHFAARQDRSGFIGLGHRRLSIIDLNTGQQPIWNREHTCCIIYNGEVYNYRELRVMLENRGYVFATQSDTEVVLLGYQELGVKILDRLEGMFAFAIWDSQTERLFLARDRIGIKPLYYYSGPHGEIAFGSELKALLPLLEQRNINQAALYHYLLYGFVQQGESIFKGIFHLKPGHYLLWQNGHSQVQRYWKLERRDAPVRSEAEWTELVFSKLQEAVKSHMIADVPVGLTLSGGLDSSSVLALMSQVTDPALLNAVTVGYNRPDDETRYSRIAAAAFPIHVHEHHYSISDIGEQFGKILYHMEEPLAHPVLGTTFFLGQSVRQHLKVVLIGEGSDELFAGYPHYRLFTFPYSLAPERMTRHFFKQVAYLMPGWRELAGLLQPEWLDRNLLRELAHYYDSYFADGITGERGLHFEIEAELVGSQLLRIDKLTMAHSVEARVPFLDREFVEMAFSIPFEYKMKNGVEKYILRQAMAPHLPAEVTWRPKSGPKGTQALLKPLMTEALLPHFGDAIGQSAIAQRGIFHPEKLRRRFEEGRMWDRLNPVRSRSIMKFHLAVLTLEVWCQQFLDPPNKNWMQL